MPTEPILFDALCTPPPSLNDRGLRVVGFALAGFGAVFGLGFGLFGAWPVFGFFGLEVALVLGLLVLHRRRATRAPQRVELVGDTLHAGGRALSAYWTRVELAAGAHGMPRLLLRDRGRVVEIGQALGEDARRSLAGALQAALAAYRQPRFDREPPISRSAPGS